MRVSPFGVGHLFLNHSGECNVEKFKTGEVVQLNSVGLRMSVTSAPAEAANASYLAGISSEKAAFPFDAVAIL